MDEISLWLDDLRVMPEGFNTWAHNAEEAIRHLQTGRVRLISFDHDLGDGEGTGYTVAKYIERAVHDGEMICPEWRIHSANPVGVKNIKDAMLSAERIARSTR